MTHADFLNKCNDIQDCDTMLCEGKADLSTLIESEMRHYRMNFTIDPGVLKIFDGFVPSHSATFFREHGQLYVYGSIFTGFKPELFTANYSENDNLRVFRSSVSITQAQKDSAFAYAQMLVDVTNGYPIYELITWMLYIRTKWKYPMVWGGIKRQVCFAQAYRMRQQVDSRFTKQPQIASCFDLIMPDFLTIMNTSN
jgi:hypothetical protein